MEISEKTRDFVCTILDCGHDDLRMLDDIQYDPDELYEYLKEDELPPTLNNFIKAVFYKVKDALSDAILAKNKLSRKKQEKYETLYPWTDFSYYVNCLDTHMFLENKELYDALLKDTGHPDGLAELEQLSGFNFEG